MHTGLVRFFEDMRGILSEYNHYQDNPSALKAILSG